MMPAETVSVYESFLSEFHSEIQVLLNADIQENSVLFESTQKLRKYLTTGELCFLKLFMDFSLTAA
jgi:PHP family Zn ribbon phosphoesterase